MYNGSTQANGSKSAKATRAASISYQKFDTKSGTFQVLIDFLLLTGFPSYRVLMAARFCNEEKSPPTTAGSPHDIDAKSAKTSLLVNESMQAIETKAREYSRHNAVK